MSPKEALDIIFQSSIFSSSDQADRRLGSPLRISVAVQVERNLLQNKENLFEAHHSLSGSLHGAMSGEGSQGRETPQGQDGAENGMP